MILLHQYPAVWDLPSLSPFCIKVETYLLMANLPYKIIIENNPRKGPKGKMPVIQDGNNIIADSTFIIDYLDKTYHIHLDKHLSPSQKALSHAIKIMIEEHLYFILLYSRWIDPVGKFTVNKEFRQFFPSWLSGLALRWIRRNLKNQAYHQGLGRHSTEEIYSLGQHDILTLSHFITDEHFYFFGDKPQIVDTTIYAFLSTILQSPFSSILKQQAMKHKNLVNYCDRVKNMFYKY